MEARGAAAAWEKARCLECRRGLREGGGGGEGAGVWVDPSKSLGFFKQAQIITSVRGTRALLRGEPPRRAPSLGAIFRRK